MLKYYAHFCNFSGAARGCGWQKLCAFINLGAYYVVGLPSSVLFAFVFHTGGMVYLYYSLNSCPQPLKHSQSNLNLLFLIYVPTFRDYGWESFVHC